MNTQFAIQTHADGSEDIFVLEVNPRASRTVPFVSKATGLPLAKIAARCMVGATLEEQGTTTEVVPEYTSVKEAVFPFAKFQNVDPILGPEMRSTGEVMGWDRSFPRAFLKAQMGAGAQLPEAGLVFVSVRDADKTAELAEAARELTAMGFKLVATRGTAEFLRGAGVETELVNKVYEGRPNIVDRLKNGEIAMVLNTTEGAQAIADSREIRAVALNDKIPYYTTAAGSIAAVAAIKSRGEGEVGVRSLQA